MHVAHEAALALHHNRVEEAGTLHGGAERAPAWPGRPWETTALSRRLPSLRLRQSSALAGGCAGANGTGREEGPAGIVRWIPRHPPSSIPPAGTRGCHGQAQRAKGDPRFPNVPKRSGQPSAALASDPAPASPGVCHAPPSRHHFCLSLTQHGSDNRGYDPPLQGLGGPSPVGTPQPSPAPPAKVTTGLPRSEHSTRGRGPGPAVAQPQGEHPHARGWMFKSLPPSLRSLLCLGQVTARRATGTSAFTSVHTAGTSFPCPPRVHPGFSLLQTLLQLHGVLPMDKPCRCLF